MGLDMNGLLPIPRDYYIIPARLSIKPGHHWQMVACLFERTA
jgi:hypothetical protein